MSDEILEKTNDAPENTQEQSTPKNVLFGAISYNDEVAYENFIQGMDLNQAIFVLVASSNYAQSKGAYNLLESETISSAIRAIRKKSGEVTEPTKDAE